MSFLMVESRDLMSLNPRFSEIAAPNTLRDSLRQALRDAILKGKLAPGEPINQVTLSKEFGVSRGPLREALSLLEEEGLVTNIPYRGTFVADFNDRIIQDTYSLRRVLEQFAVELAMMRSTPAEMAELRAVYQNMVTAVNTGHMEQFHELDLAFHRQIYAMAEHELLLQMWTTIEANVERSIFYGNFQHQDEPSQILLDSHRLILEAIESGDIAAAKREIDRQLNSACDTLVAKWKRYNSSD
jgi:DNA-binding GntR family transcriptional regulator